MIHLMDVGNNKVLSKSCYYKWGFFYKWKAFIL